MTVNYTSLLSLGQPVTGTESGTWGDDVNNALTAYLDIAIAGTLTFTGDGAVTLSNTQGTSSASNISSTTAQYSILKVVGPLTATKVFTAPSTSKTYIVNNTDATYGVTIKAFGQTGVTVDANRKALVMFNGTDYAFVSGDDITKFLGTLPVANGGTGQTTFTDGQLLIGNSSGNTLTKATLTAGANVTITNGPGSIQISATGGGGGGGGTVTSVALSAGSTGFTVSGSPITTSGTFTLGGTLSVGSGGTGLTATPTNGQIDIGNGSGFTRTTLTAGSGISITNGAGSVTIAATGGGGGGTVTSVALSPGSTGLTVSGSPIITSGTFTLGGTLGVGSGGTGLTATPSNGQLDIGNGSGFTRTTLTAGSGISIANGSGSISIDNAGVTSLAGTANQVTVSASTGSVTLSTPQSIGTSSSVQFGSFGVGTAASGTSGEIRATNNVTAFYSSDRRLKENIRDIPDALSTVMAIGGKLFDWKDEYIASKGGEDGYFIRKADFGVVAQDVQQVFPQAVREREDGMLAVDYEKLCALAFAAIRELKAEVEKLKEAK